MNKDHVHTKKSEISSACGIAMLILVAIEVSLIVFSVYLPYPPVHILIMLLLQPLLINLLLMIPMENSHPPEHAPPEQPQEDELPAGRMKTVARKFRAASQHLYSQVLRLFLARRVAIVSCLCITVVLGIHAHLYLHRVTAPVTDLFIPVILGSNFFTLIILDTWCRFVLRGTDENQSRFCVILRNLQNHIRIDKFIFLVAGFVASLPLLGLPNLWKPLYYALWGMLALQSLGILYLFAVRFMRQELNSNPDLRIFCKGRNRQELSIIDHLEQNTGLTMRSLWSLNFIKQQAPIAIALSIVFLWLSTGIVQISSNEQGALYRMGKLQPQPLRPGLHVTLPWPFDSVDLYDTESLKEITIGYIPDQVTANNLWTDDHGGEENKLLLGNGNELVSINLRLEYKISDLNAYLRSSSSPESLLESAAYEVVTANTISTNLEKLLDVDRMAFSKHFQEDLAERIGHYNTGLEVVNVVVESIHPPVEVTDIYQRIISAGIMAEKYIIESEAWADVLVARAEDSYNTAVNEAIIKSNESIAQAKANVAQFEASIDAENTYGMNYRYYKYLDAISAAYANAQLIIVDEGVDGSSLYLGHLPQ